MSEFKLALTSVLQHEGQFVDDAEDPGGATHWGISLRFLQQCRPNVTVNDIRQLSMADAIRIYDQEWWERYHYADILSQPLAAKVLDLAVNMGSVEAHICLQRAIRAASGKCLVEDGVLGSQTLMMVNTANPQVLLAALKSEAAGFYRNLHQPRFEKGWLNRAYD